MHVFYKEEFKLGVSPHQRSVEQALEHGVVCIDKPQGPSSHEVSAFVKKILHVNKAGHTGTLDPNVSGVLPVLLNQGCKVSHFLGETSKTYVCVMQLEKEVSKKDLVKAFNYFKGKIYQTPPLLSAVAKNLRIREVKELKILEVKERNVLFSVSSEAGFYVRNLVFDVGEVLGVKAEMAELRRTKAGVLTEDKCITLQELSDYYWLWKEKGNDEKLKKAIIPIEDFVKLKRVIASDDCLRPISTGADLAIPGILAMDEKIQRGERVGIFTGKGELVAVATALRGSSEIKDLKKGMAFDIERVIQGF
ncbi:MAG: RNA-guided pseudouridylation complex pseudouridine synthase subunit Cbf5 [Candidatus Micrarchaeota archaeon]|nr:RNA-guided pseudouridylation complex pseudouridine synthase subunit Cbf5 [Candidatus Micrarchaeota archaeon]